MAKSKKAYLGLGLPWIVNVLLAFFFGWPLAIIERLVQGKILLAILAIPFGAIFWLVDFISMLVNKDLEWLI
jgi:hypothetical protein